MNATANNLIPFPKPTTKPTTQTTLVDMVDLMGTWIGLYIRHCQLHGEAYAIRVAQQSILATAQTWSDSP